MLKKVKNVIAVITNLITNVEMIVVVKLRQKSGKQRLRRKLIRLCHIRRRVVDIM